MAECKFLSTAYTIRLFTVFSITQSNTSPKLNISFWPPFLFNTLECFFHHILKQFLYQIIHHPNLTNFWPIFGILWLLIVNELDGVKVVNMGNVKLKNLVQQFNKMNANFELWKWFSQRERESEQSLITKSVLFLVHLKVHQVVTLNSKVVVLAFINHPTINHNFIKLKNNLLPSTILFNMYCFSFPPENNFLKNLSSGCWIILLKICYKMWRKKVVD